MSPTARPELSGRLHLLRTADLVIEGRLVDASNGTFFARLGTDETSSPACVYKPVRGERPLWDFPNGTLANREYAVYLIAEATGWAVVPPTVLRDGPFGPGMAQWWIEDATCEGLVQIDQDPDGSIRLSHADHAVLRRIAVLDIVVNNADRKGSHLLRDPEGEIWAIDHGVCLHAEPKLRTVLWGWAGSALTDAEVGALRVLQRALDAELGVELAAVLSPHERSALAERVATLLSVGALPAPQGDWPALPWPPV